MTSMLFECFVKKIQLYKLQINICWMNGEEMKETDLTKGRVISVITALALPIMGSSFLQFTYNLIDMMWVGGLGSGAVASIGSSSLYINIGYLINALVVIGAGIL